LIIGLLFGFFQQATGISMVTFFSNEIFSKGKTGASAELAARIGTFGTGIAGVLAAIAAIIMTRHYGRRTLLIVGEVLMAFLLAFLSNCAFSDYQTLTIIATVLFVFVFNTSFGPILWLYVSEILGAKGISLVAFINLLFTVVFGCLGNIFIELLTPAGMYITLFFIQIICIVFLQHYVIETKGKTREE
jgi:MFS family permease